MSYGVGEIGRRVTTLHQPERRLKPFIPWILNIARSPETRVMHTFV